MSTDKILGVRISGHAGFESYGNDLISQACRRCILATVNALEEYVGLDTGVTVESGGTSFSAETQINCKSIQFRRLSIVLYMALSDGRRIRMIL